MSTRGLKNARGVIVQGVDSKRTSPSSSVAPLTTNFELVVHPYHSRFCDMWYTLHRPPASSMPARLFRGDADQSQQMELSFSCCASQALGAPVANFQWLFLGRSEASCLALLRTSACPLASDMLPLNAGGYRNETWSSKRMKPAWEPSAKRIHLQRWLYNHSAAEVNRPRCKP